MTAKKQQIKLAVVTYAEQYIIAQRHSKYWNASYARNDMHSVCATTHRGASVLHTDISTMTTRHERESVCVSVSRILVHRRAETPECNKTTQYDVTKVSSVSWTEHTNTGVPMKWSLY